MNYRDFFYPILMKKIIHSDIVVVGGGPAGVAAAVAAAENGLKVILIERNSFLGGKATAAEVGTICGLYAFSKNDPAALMVNGFASQFAESLQEDSKTEPVHHPAGLHYLPYDVAVFKNNCQQLMNKHRVDVYFNAALNSANIENNLIRSVEISIANQPVQIFLQSIVDCSGESIVSRLINLPLITSDTYQAAAHIFVLKNIGETSEARLGMILMKELQSAIIEKKLDTYYDRVYIVPGSLKNNSVHLKIGIPLPVTHTPENLLALQTTAHAFIHTLTNYLVQHVPVFKNAVIDHIAPETGIRVGMRTTGKYILTEKDVLECRKFNDAIANAAWPIEEWEQNKRVKMRYFSLDDFYQIPARCLQSAFVDNLFVGGRNISATNGAIASARVIGICLQTGYAAGKLAAAHALHLSQQEAVIGIQRQQC